MEKTLYKLIKSSMAQTGLKIKRTPSSPIVLIPSHTDRWTTCTHHLLFWWVVLCPKWKLTSQYTVVKNWVTRIHILVYLSSSCLKQVFPSRNFLEIEGIEINRFIAFIVLSLHASIILPVYHVHIVLAGWF